MKAAAVDCRTSRAGKAAAGGSGAVDDGASPARKTPCLGRAAGMDCPVRHARRGPCLGALKMALPLWGTPVLMNLLLRGAPMPAKVFPLNLFAGSTRNMR